MRRDRARLVGRAGYEHVHEVTVRTRSIGAAGEYPHLVAHAGISQVRDPQTSLNYLGEGQRRPKAATALYRQTDDIGAGKFETSFYDEVLGDDRVEKAVVENVVDVA